ncbi:SMP-30/gluconolactonase/LRE family protein [Nocardia sp. NBC_01503]|uniref:SMP-30/gluconolactonase/LRE family protein n=1 Tax=Nocardia sp. NBC_01503 TaxID=2975997 RepID=UPI002E7BB4A6|nr:SMP-30/gluconolactonase/LRE family protein [Nocardia sp. NBC_01503]WTL33025.1 SMP-30/gluconolactonase/LRE family protein [Nocardia sp. NBC_01503]
MTRLRLALPAAAAMLALTACTNSQEAATPAATPQISTAYELPDAKAYPEGIAVDSHNGDIYVGSFTNGAIYRAAKDHSKAEVFLPSGTDGRHTANGLRVDTAGRLWVIDHSTGVAVYDTGTRALIARFDVPQADKPFLNDLAITPDGSVYLTDSVRPILYRVTPDELTAAIAHGGRAELPFFTNLTKDPAPQSIPLLNGIVADPSGRYLLVVDMPTGDLYRVALDAQRTVSKVTRHGGTMINGDGLEMRGDTLWVVQNKDNTVSRWRVTDDGATVEQQQRITDAALAIPTTIAHIGDRALVVVSQFDRGGPMGAGTPAPFTVAAIDGI